MQPIAITDQDPILINAEEAGKLLGLSRSQVNKMAARGEIPHIRIGRALRYPLAALRRWADERAEGAGNAAM